MTDRLTDLPKTVTLNFYTDPGHGWLEVEKTLIRALHLQPSTYSYQRDDMAYLEEDCDAYAFMEAAKAKGITVSIQSHNEPMRDSFVRSLPRIQGGAV
ncbi:hypothetical protein UFOVP33_50 [uncultured Caudovirales phage]|uniref:Uncharacterized protein n=1 Tax=uncultured Caudovirales phage TaxID=2100421 RepID=A0A6J5KLX4_9CAUD|nr:hypothetical protein UFOVP33_50 [uncultured Caudovirales phage]